MPVFVSHYVDTECGESSPVKYNHTCGFVDSLFSRYRRINLVAEKVRFGYCFVSTAFILMVCITYNMYFSG